MARPRRAGRAGEEGELPRPFRRRLLLVPLVVYVSGLAALVLLAAEGLRALRRLVAQGVEERLLATAARHLLLAGAAVAALGALAALLWARWRIRAEAERALSSEHEALKARFALLERHGNDIVMLLDEAGNVVEANDRACEAYGLPLERLRGLPVAALRAPDSGPSPQERLGEIRRRGGLVFETRQLRASGEEFPVEISTRAFEVDGRLFYYSVGRDISERRRIQRRLRESEDRLRAILRDLPVALVALDRDGTVTLGEGLHLPLAGVPPGEAVGQSAFVLLAHLSGAQQVLRRALAGETLVQKARIDGRRVECHFTPLRDALGALAGTVCVAADVTERHRLRRALRESEERLRLAERMASLGQLAAGVAHEINNPLSYVVSNLSYAVEELRARPDAGEVIQALEDAHTGAQRARDIVRDLRTFAQPGGDRMERVDVRQALSSVLALAAGELKHRGRLVTRYQEVPPVLASERRLSQVLLNLVVNAVQALDPQRAAQNEVRVEVASTPGGRVAVVVTDTGCGMSPEVRARLFEPFFTTRPTGAGTGLGLSVCHGIVKALGGDIEVESQEGMGSTFRVLLPAAEVAAPGEPRPVPLQAADEAAGPQGPQARV